MRKSEIVRTIADKTGLTQVKAEEVVDAVFDEIKATLSQGDVVILRRFGTFSVRAKQARQGRNPKTGEPSDISARHVVRFRPGRQLRAAVAHAPKAMSREGKAR
jgi:nucleoid DNA-binding protein